MSTVATARMTAEEFFDWANQPENAGKRYELENGEPIEMPPPGDRHGTVNSWIGHLLWMYAIRRGRGRVSSNDSALIVEIDPPTVRGPDLMFFDESTPVANISPRFPNALPSLVVEVLSPSDRWSKVQIRVKQYLQRGVPLVWIVDPIDYTVTVFRAGEMQVVLEESDELTGNGVLPDFRCRVAELFSLPGLFNPQSEG